eukprot:TRINITY_DN6337_c0_g1_i1.p1 TRINITY_DN6337_c0_g1~~TRINITY_DN6337_c0_g1_i1.p1  ORF type:complete len:107 (+),score=16.27 TRINITY_DN6337_c0_g1_i1:24-323(+)
MDNKPRVVLSKIELENLARERLRKQAGRTFMRRRNLGLGMFLASCAALGFCYPFYLRTKGTGVDYSQPLAPQNAVRGVYLNTGTKDAGPNAQYKPPTKE